MIELWKPTTKGVKAALEQTIQEVDCEVIETMKHVFRTALPCVDSMLSSKVQAGGSLLEALGELWPGNMALAMVLVLSYSELQNIKQNLKSETSSGASSEPAKKRARIQHADNHAKIPHRFYAWSTFFQKVQRDAELCHQLAEMERFCLNGVKEGSRGPLLLDSNGVGGQDDGLHSFLQERPELFPILLEDQKEEQFVADLKGAQFVKELEFPPLADSATLLYSAGETTSNISSVALSEIETGEMFNMEVGLL